MLSHVREDARPALGDQQHLVRVELISLFHASVPLAAGALAPIGFVLPMSVGAILMSASTVVVALNAQLLRRLDLSPATSTAKFIDDQSAA